jgi:light-regulated signal transduction histidine kinase (bacteriophytochrome)
MSSSPPAFAGEPIDLSNCPWEPIHVPGAIQAHGVLLVLREPDLIVIQVSDNTPELLGVVTQDLLGRSLMWIYWNPRHSENGPVPF